MNNETLFIYHGGCFDGFTSAWIYSRFVNREAEFFPARYGDAPPDVRGRDLVIADFSYPRDVMFKIACDAASLMVLDHHHTAQEALDGLEKQVLLETGREVRIVFDMKRSGAGLTWDEFARGEVHGMDSAACPTFYDVCNCRVPLVNYIEDRDLWRMSLPNVHEFMAVVASMPMSFEAWDELHAMPFDRAVDRGAGILAYIREYGTKALAEARMMEWPSLYGKDLGVGVLHWAVNLPYMNCSDHLTRLLEERGAMFVAGYFRRGDGRWQFSLRSTADFDCSQVAKLFGGGGHKQAAGFDVADLVEVFGEQ